MVEQIKAKPEVLISGLNQTLSLKVCAKVHCRLCPKLKPGHELKSRPGDKIISTY